MEGAPATGKSGRAGNREGTRLLRRRARRGGARCLVRVNAEGNDGVEHELVQHHETALAAALDARRDGDGDGAAAAAVGKALAARGCTVTHGARGAEAATAGEIALAAALGVRRDGECGGERRLQQWAKHWQHAAARSPTVPEVLKLRQRMKPRSQPHSARGETVRRCRSAKVNVARAGTARLMKSSCDHRVWTSRGDADPAASTPTMVAHTCCSLAVATEMSLARAWKWKPTQSFSSDGGPASSSFLSSMSKPKRGTTL